MGQTCGKPTRVAPQPVLESLTILWDVENLPIPRKDGKAAKDVFTAGDVGEALLARCEQASGGTCSAARVLCVHPERYPIPLKNSLRTRGVQMLDAGPKRGAVDTHLKGYLNDLLVDYLLEQGSSLSGEGSRAGEGGSASSRRWVWLASGDADFAGDVRRARKCGFKVGIIHGAASNADFFGQADASLTWDNVLADCTAKVGRKASLSSSSAGAGAAGSVAGGAPAPGESSSSSRADSPAPSGEADGPVGEGSSSSSSSSSGGDSMAVLPGEAVEVASPSAGTSNTRPPCKFFSTSGGCTRKNCRFPHVAA